MGFRGGVGGGGFGFRGGEAGGFFGFLGCGFCEGGEGVSLDLREGVGIDGMGMEMGGGKRGK